MLSLTHSHLVGNRIQNFFRWARVYSLIALCYILWVACLIVIAPYISIYIPNQWVELAWYGFIFIIPFFFLLLAISAVVNKLMWTISSKKLHVKGFDFCVTRGPGKNVKKDIIHGIKNPNLPGLDVDFEIQDYGSLSQFGMEGPFDCIHPVGCIEDDGIEAQVDGVPAWYSPLDLPEPIKSRYVRKRIDPITGQTYYEYLRKKKGICLVVPAVDTIKKVVVGANYLHDQVQLAEQTQEALRAKLRLMSIKYGEEEEPITKPVDRTQDTVLVPR